MDVSEKITPQDKAQIKALNVECQVLRNLLNEREGLLKAQLARVLSCLVVDPRQYSLRVDFAADKWLMELRPDVLALPGKDGLNRAERRELERRN